jgi:branched-chain amino acid transport system permease protein
VSNTVNFAQGGTMMMGAVLSFTLSVTAGWPLMSAVPVALVACALWSILVERVAVRPFVRRGSNSWLMATVALGIALENVALFTFGRDPRGMPPNYLTSHFVIIGGLKTQYLQLLIPLVGLGLALSLHAFFQHTRQGKALLAVVQNAGAARLMGIDVERITTLAYALSGMLAGSAWGVVLAGLIYGVAEALVTACLGSTYTQIVSFSLVIASLTVMPNGLFGRAGVRKV